MPDGDRRARPGAGRVMEIESLTGLVRARHGAGLRSLTLFGSCLAPTTRRPGSIPDLFAVVDELDVALKHEGIGPIARAAARFLPPATVAFRDPGCRGTLAKLNLIEPGTAARALRTPRDLYLAGRLGKHTRTLWVRDEACARELDALLDAAAAAIVEVVLNGLGARCSLEAAVRQCVAISYAAEVRPESPAKIEALQRAFAAEYEARYRPLLVARARARGLTVEGDD
ncbi:MAG: hypothetical protein WAM82_26855, partial [Thermoanaerobaculia bacterium]